ncbi:MAG: hypothetical protein ACO3I0_01750 [Limisphaerales bacterium]
MKRLLGFLGSILLLLSCGAAERVFNFTTNTVGKPPEGFRAFVVGQGPAPDWQIIQAEVPSQFAPLLQDRPATYKMPVLAQLSKDPADERFPVLYFAGERYGDFTFTTRFRIVSGLVDQIAGVVFRMQDEKNFYVVRASGRGNIRFYKFVDGQRTTPIGNDVPVRRGEWHELTVKTLANKIDVLLDGRTVIPTLTDNSFQAGRVGFMTKSDSISEFLDAKVEYQPLVTVAEQLVQETLRRQSRLRNLRLYAKTGSRPDLHVIAAKDPSEIGLAAGEAENGVLESNETYFGKAGKEFLVTCPLRDRNGEVVAVVKFFLEPFTGQTEKNAIARVTPTLRWMEGRLATAEGLTME